LGLNDVSELEVVGVRHDGTKANSACHGFVDEHLGLFANYWVSFEVNAVLFILLTAVQVFKSDFDGFSCFNVLSVHVEGIGREVVDALAGVGLTNLDTVSAFSGRASWGSILGAVAVVFDVTEAAVPAGTNISALAVNGDGAEVLDSDSAQVELEPLGDEAGVLGSDCLDLLDVVRPEDFAD